MKRLHEINYREAREQFEPERGVPGKMPVEGLWLPVSIAALYSGVSPQTVRLLMLDGKIRSLKFSVGPILVDARFIPAFLNPQDCRRNDRQELVVYPRTKVDENEI